MKLKILLTTYYFLLTTSSAFAQFTVPPSLPGPGAQVVPGPATTRLLTILNRLTNWALVFLIAISVAFIVYAAYLYLTAAGDADKAKDASRVILYAVIAIAVGLMAKVIIAIVQGLVG